MISKGEILDIAQEYSLRPDVVEKDYVLSWLLAGISAHPALSGTWLFKGGTCLKKCYLETYRLSEDLDFTLSDVSQLKKPFLKKVFGEVSEWVYEHSGIELPVSQQSFEIITGSKGRIICQGRIAYQGPISPHPPPRIKLDLTSSEKIVRPPVRVPIFHQYSDSKNINSQVLSYSYEEAFGEKVRALAERTRPRDLYDVITLFRYDANLPNPLDLQDVINQKCQFKNITFPSADLILDRRQALTGSWSPMLGHQLPTLPAPEIFLQEVPKFFDWLNGAYSYAALPAYPGEINTTLLCSRKLPDSLPLRIRSALMLLRFAGSTRLTVRIIYRQKNGDLFTQEIEPYSIRLTETGKAVLLAADCDSGQLRSCYVDQIVETSVTTRPFEPRYRNELNPKPLAS